MLIIILGSIAFLVFKDAKLLQQQNGARYTEVFDYNPKAWALWHFILGVAVLPVYLLRRNRFKNSLAITPSVPQNGDPAASETPLSYQFFVASDAFILLLNWIMGMTVWMILVEIFFIFYPQFGEGIEEMTISAVFSSLWMIFLIFTTTQHYRDEKFYDFIALKRRGNSLLKLVVLPMIIGIVFACISSFVIMDRSVQPETPLSKIIGSTSSLPWLMIFIATAIIVAPLLEEITFRGYFYRVLSLTKGKVFAVAMISFFFAFLHVGQYWGDWSAIGMVAALGLVLTLLRMWTGSTIASAFTHYFYNTGVTVIPVLMLVFSNPAYLEYRMKFDQIDNATKEILLQKSIKADPSLAEAYNDLAWVYAEQDEKLDEAFSLIDKALSLEPDNVAFLDTKAEVMFKLGHVEEAISIEGGIVTDDSLLSAQVEKQLKKFMEARKTLPQVN